MSELSMIKGIGPSTINKLNKLNINTIDDLITYYPYKYELLKKTGLNEDNSVISCSICSSVNIFYFHKLNSLRFKVIYDNKIINVIIYNRAFLKPNLSINKVITLIGKYDYKTNLFTASDIKLFDIGDREEITPRYHLVKGLNNTNLNKYINIAIDNSLITDYIPDVIKKKNHFIDKREALKIIHNPDNKKDVSNAIIRSKYEELFLFMLKINELKNKNSKNNKGFIRNIDKEVINNFLTKLPFSLTEDQNKTINEIFNDLSSPKRMNRLVQGDVGSGKTIVAFISMYALTLDHYQSALMAPTEILAHQHYLNMVELFKDTNMKIKEILGSTSKKEKDVIKKELKNGEIDVLIGTHALLEDSVEFNNLGLIITDEQHRFGVNQRSNFRNKGNMVDVLYLSATPIPRTYALTIYGDMDISIIKTMPKGRKPVKTYVKEEKDIVDILQLMKHELDNKHQVYIVSPLIESEDEEADVKKLYNKFSLAFKNNNIGILHGKMSSKEKDSIMKKFQNNEIDILISTTVIEVGVDAKNATMIVIFDAYKFGLATLHQLRGRVGRNSYDSYCILVTNRESKRLDIMESVNDGFKLAEEDFKLRGSGDLFGTKQSGDMNFKIANLTKDYNILLQAKEDSDIILKEIDNYIMLKDILKKSINQD